MTSLEAKERKERKEGEFSPVILFREMQKDAKPRNVFSEYSNESVPFWGDGSDQDIFKAHPMSKKAIPYRPK